MTRIRRRNGRGLGVEFGREEGMKEKGGKEVREKNENGRMGVREEKVRAKLFH